MPFGSKELAKLLKKGGKEVIEALTEEPKVKPKPKPKAEEPKVKPKPKPKAEETKVEKRGRKRKARGRSPATDAQKKGAKKAGVGVKAFRALSQDEQKKWIKVDKPKAAAAPKRTRKEEAELDRLKAEQQEEMDAALRPPKRTSVGTRRMKLTPEGQRLFDAGEFDEIIANPKKYMTHGFDAPLRPKGTELTRSQLAKMKKGSAEDKAQAIREMLNDPGHVVGTPVQISPQLRGKASAKELEAMQKEIEGSQFKSEINPETGEDWTAGLKGGGRLKYYKKGGRIKKSSKKPRGVGAALRGYGKAMRRG